MKTIIASSLCLLILCISIPVRAGVVINEVLYHSPNDLNDLEYIELFNAGDEPVKLAGWELSKGVKFDFPRKTVIEPKGFVVICKDQELFEKFYGGVETVGEYKKSLSNGSDKINLKDSDGEVVDTMEYDDRAPWPVAADGYSASLERICPTGDSESPDNWAPSVLSDDYDRKPSGTPGAQNSVFQPAPPPVIEKVLASAEEVCEPGSAIKVTATVNDSDKIDLLYRVARPGGEGDEVAIPMKRATGGRFKATIPAQEADRIVRFRVRAKGKDGAVRHFPALNEIRPALSVYVSEPIAVDQIPVGHFFNVGEAEFKRATDYREEASRPQRRWQPGRFGRGPGGGFDRREESPEDRARRERERAWRDADRQLRDDRLVAAWSSLTLGDGSSAPRVKTLLPAFRSANGQLDKLREQLREADDIQKEATKIPNQLEDLEKILIASMPEKLSEAQRSALAAIGGGDEQDRGRDPREMLRRFHNVEQTWFRIAMHEDVDAAAVAKARGSVIEGIKLRDATKIEAGEGGRPDFRAIMGAVEGLLEGLNSELEDDLGEELFAKLELDGGGRRGGGRRPGGWGPERRPATPLRPQGRSAFIYTDPKTKTTRLFDFVNITPRKSGHKVRLHKDRMLDGMTIVNVIYEADERTFLNESLAYDLYRAAGNITQRAGYMRVLVDGKLVGHQLWFEQPNGAFLRHNDIDDKGNMYKVNWMGQNVASEFTPEDKKPDRRRDVVGRHEKKSNPHDGYDDLIDLAEALEEAEGDDAKMWRLIEKHFDVEHMVNYFAVNSLLSHWDGFFNNYFPYHDTRNDKWEMYPWDQDSTWSQRGGDLSSLSAMPLNFGAADAEPPGGRGSWRGGFGGGGVWWWRDGGEISKPLLANPRFRERFQDRLDELCGTVFTEGEFGKRIRDLEHTLEPEVKLRAKLRGTDEAAAVKELSEIMGALRDHLEQRRAFILAQLGSAPGGQ